MPWPEWTCQSIPQSEELDLIRRLLILRKQRLVGPILAEFGSYWICSCELDPHGSKEYYSWDRLFALVNKLESDSLLERKKVGTAQEITGAAQCDETKSFDEPKRSVNGRD